VNIWNLVCGLLFGDAVPEMIAEAQTRRGVAATAVDTAVVPAQGSDFELIERIQGGDQEACEILVREYGGRMLSVARRLLRNEEDARDAMQEAFFCAFRSLRDFKGTARLSTWLHRILVNACLMKLRSSSRRPEASIEELLPTFDSTGHQVDPAQEWPQCPESQSISRELREQVRAAIETLPANYRAVLMLRDIEELSTQEVAKILGLTPMAVKVRLHRARQALRTLLERALPPR
jgi:RNA polymerase sigma-70 factor (ECF subfamily)